MKSRDKNKIKEEAARKEACREQEEMDAKSPEDEKLRDDGVQEESGDVSQGAPEQGGEGGAEEALQTAKDRVAELEDQHLRLVAEYDNFRKRSRREKDQLYRQSVCDVVKALLPVLDSLDRAGQAAELLVSEEGRQMAAGIELVRKQATESLKNLGVEEILCEGESFDPELHDAVQHIEDEALPPNTIAKVILKGYKGEESVIRHSLVLVAN